MALWDWMTQRASLLESASSPAEASRELVRQWRRNHQEGKPPELEDPGRIYRYFTEGPGTEGYQHAREVAGKLADSLAESADGLHAIRAGLAGHWGGRAAEAALGALAPLRDRLDAVAKQAREGADMLAEQVAAFTETRRRVLPVAERAPRAGGLDAVRNPVLMLRDCSADTEVGAYQGAARVNQLAYTEYSATVARAASHAPEVPGEQGRSGTTGDVAAEGGE